MERREAEKIMSENISQEEQKEYIEYMLHNEKIEKSLINWKQNQNSDTLTKMLEIIAAESEECAGLILSVNSDTIPTGADNIVLFTGSERGDIHRLIDKAGKSYAMVFTSKERFQECNDTSGFVMFIDDLFHLLAEKEELDGMVINIGQEDIAFNKYMMKVVIWLIGLVKEKNFDHTNSDDDSSDLL